MCSVPKGIDSSRLPGSTAKGSAEISIPGTKSIFSFLQLIAAACRPCVVSWSVNAIAARFAAFASWPRVLGGSVPSEAVE